MQLVVQKYGGSSVATLEKMNKIADAVIKRKEEGVNVVIVVSAMGKTTNNLIEMVINIRTAP